MRPNGCCHMLQPSPSTSRSATSSRRETSTRDRHRPSHPAHALLRNQEYEPVTRSWEETELGWASFSDSYRRWSLIGCGTSGQVHVATHIDRAGQLAVKTLPKVVGKTPRAQLLDDILLEASVLERMQGCPGVARLIESCEDAKYAYLVTELCRGGDLRHYVEAHGPLTEQRLACVALQVLRVVQHCHELGVLHGDLKPSNFCFVDPQAFESPVVPLQSCLRGIDFGCSRLVGPGQRLVTKAVGSYAFLAPEVVEQDYGLKADVWSIGVMLYWLYSYRFPFMNTAQISNNVDPEEVRSAVLHGPIPLDYGPWLQLSPEGLDFISGCLRRCEGERMSVEQALQHPWIQSAALLQHLG